jgi:hypothetical protein
VLCAGNSQYLNLRKHGSTRPLEQTWEQQEDDGGIPLTYSNLMDSNPGSNRDSDYELMYGPVSQESLGGSQQGFPVNTEQDKRTGYGRVKRNARHVHGLQRLTSLGRYLCLQCYCWLQEIKNYVFGAACGGITLISNIVKIGHVLQLQRIHTERHSIVTW